MKRQVGPLDDFGDEEIQDEARDFYDDVFEIGKETEREPG